MSDSTLENIRETRKRISERFQHNPQQLINHYREFQSNYETRLIQGETGKPQELFLSTS